VDGIPQLLIAQFRSTNFLSRWNMSLTSEYVASVRKQTENLYP